MVSRLIVMLVECRYYMLCRRFFWEIRMFVRLLCRMTVRFLVRLLVVLEVFCVNGLDLLQLGCGGSSRLLLMNLNRLNLLN